MTSHMTVYISKYKVHCIRKVLFASLYHKIIQGEIKDSHLSDNSDYDWSLGVWCMTIIIHITKEARLFGRIRIMARSSYCLHLTIFPKTEDVNRPNLSSCHRFESRCFLVAFSTGATSSGARVSCKHQNPSALDL